MKLNIILEEFKIRKYRFDKTQSIKLSSLLKKIIDNEKNPKMKSRFINLDGLIRGTFPSLASFQKASKGIEKIFLEIKNNVRLTEEVSKVNKLKKVLVRLISSVIFIANLASCDLMTTFDTTGTIEDAYLEYGAALMTKGTDEIYEVRLSDEKFEEIYNALKAYIEYQDASGLLGVSFEPLRQGLNGDYNFLDGRIRINSNVSKNAWFSILIHEKAHREQGKTGVLVLPRKGLDDPKAYSINPMEINAEFNRFLAIAIKNDNRQAIPTTHKLIMAVLLTYRPEYTYKDISKKDIELVREFLKNRRPDLFEKFEEIKDSEPLIKEFFGIK